MGENSSIAWTDHTFNPWIGCAKVSPGCAHCYAETYAARFQKAKWGPGEKRVRTSVQNWNLPLRWNREAEKRQEAHEVVRGMRGPMGQGERPRRPRVFCASLADVFDAEAPDDWRNELFRLIEATPALDWLVLTKRIENAREWFGGESGAGLSAPPLPNLWLGATVEDQPSAEKRIPILCEIPAAVHYLSCEPLLEGLDLTRWLMPCSCYASGGTPHPDCEGPRPDWLIIGGESGPKARPFDVAWARSLVAQARAAGVAPFVKQLGAKPLGGSEDLTCMPRLSRSRAWATGPLELLHPAGADPSEWPADLRVREWPR